MAIPRICSIDGCGKRAIARGWCSAHWCRWKRHGSPSGGGTAWGEPQRFIDEVAIEHTADKCLFWPFGRNTHGVGEIWNGDGMSIVARVVCEEVNGPPPTPEHEAAHSCGKGHMSCCAGNHLSWKTREGNMADAIAHGTTLRGARNPNCKLNEVGVKVIRSMTGVMLQRELADIYGIERATVSHIQRRVSWAWLD